MSFRSPFKTDENKFNIMQNLRKKIIKKFKKIH